MERKLEKKEEEEKNEEEKEEEEEPSTKVFTKEKLPKVQSIEEFDAKQIATAVIASLPHSLSKIITPPSIEKTTVSSSSHIGTEP